VRTRQAKDLVTNHDDHDAQIVLTQRGLRLENLNFAVKVSRWCVVYLPGPRSLAIDVQVFQG